MNALIVLAALAWFITSAVLFALDNANRNATEEPDTDR